MFSFVLDVLLVAWPKEACLKMIVHCHVASFPIGFVLHLALLGDKVYAWASDACYFCMRLCKYLGVILGRLIYITK